MRLPRTLAAGLGVLGCLVLASCAGGRGAEPVSQAPAGIHEIESLYETATAHHRRAVRKPLRDQRARALEALASKAEQLIAETETWDSETRLTAIAEPQRQDVRNTVEQFRGSLRGLQAAAGESDIPHLRTEYARVMSTYRRLDELTASAH